MSTSGCENGPSLVTASFNVLPSFSDPAFFALTKKSLSTFPQIQILSSCDSSTRRCDRDLFVCRRRDKAIGRKRGDRRTSMPLPDRTCAVIQLRTSGWFHSPVAMDKIPSYPVTLLPCIATSLRAWRPHSSLKARTERWTERTLITIIAQLHPRQSLLCRLSLLCSTALRTIVMTRADSSSLESTKVRIGHEAS
jgi:hypothetical protein